MENILNSGKDFISSVYSYFIAVIFVFSSFFSFFEVVERPEIKTGEFDFALTYEIDGEIKTIEGTYVCKFEKVEYFLDGINRKWTGYIKGHEHSDMYALKTTDEGIIKVNPDLSPEFFMSDPHYKSGENTDFPKPEPYLYIVAEESENEYLLNRYEGDDVKIISFEYDPPIENKYK